MTLEEYTREVVEYLSNKIPDINAATAYEIAEFFVMKSNNFATDKVAENVKLWQETLRKNDRHWEKFVRNIYK